MEPYSRTFFLFLHLYIRIYVMTPVAVVNRDKSKSHPFPSTICGDEWLLHSDLTTVTYPYKVYTLLA